jgi:hypothetical protein
LLDFEVGVSVVSFARHSVTLKDITTGWITYIVPLMKFVDRQVKYLQDTYNELNCSPVIHYSNGKFNVTLSSRICALATWKRRASYFLNQYKMHQMSTFVLSLSLPYIG